MPPLTKTEEKLQSIKEIEVDGKILGVLDPSTAAGRKEIKRLEGLAGIVVRDASEATIKKSYLILMRQ